MDRQKGAVLFRSKYCFMQLEKHDEKNLYCYITENDLNDLEIFHNNLAYGSNDFRKLLSVIMMKAGEECQFTTYDLPLLAEAVPLKNQELFIQISAIDEAEELDPRFAQFSPSIFEELDLDDEHTDDDMIASEDLYIPEDTGVGKPSFPAVQETAAFSQKRRSSGPKMHKTVYTFETYDTLITALHSAGKADQFLQTRSTLYFQPESKTYYLILLRHQNTAAVRALLASFCEYATARPLTSSTHAWLTEHCRCLIRTNAIPRLLESVP